MTKEEQDEVARADQADALDAIKLARAALGKLAKIELRHRKDLAGAAASACTRAHTDEAMWEMDVRQATGLLGVLLDPMGGAV